MAIECGYYVSSNTRIIQDRFYECYYKRFGVYYDFNQGELSDELEINIDLMLDESFQRRYPFKPEGLLDIHKRILSC